MAESSSSWSRYVPLAAFAALACLLFVALFLGNPQRLPSALEGRPVPNFSLPALQPGAPPLTQVDLKGPALLNVWASWCAPCRAEHPLLMELAAAGVPIYGLNYKDEAGAARRFLARLGNPYRRTGRDGQGSVALDFGVYGVPESFIIDADGAIVHRHVGPLSADAVATEILPRLALIGN